MLLKAGRRNAAGLSRPSFKKLVSGPSPSRHRIVKVD
jgi:hypothetical protein